MAATSKNGSNPGRRLEWGEMILAAARGLDLKLIKDRFDSFLKTQTALANAQKKVDLAESRLWAVQETVGQLDALQDEAVKTLVGCLIADKQPYNKPLSKFGSTPPSKLMRLPHATEAREIHRLVAAIQNDTSLSKATQNAASAADKAAEAVGRASAPIAGLEDKVAEARAERDGLVQGWESARAGLGLAARNADHDGGTHLYDTLFAWMSTAKRRTKKAAPATAAITPTSPAQPAPNGATAP